ncbi:MAG TPA: methyltransferase, partial [Myxococcota bacterium]|nr:methyltransferase [Myxococcota bacterium]
LARRVAALWPGSSVVRLDLPEILSAWPLDGVRALAVDLADRWPVTADVIVLSRLLSEFEDGDAARVLQRAAGALAPGGRLCVIDHVIDATRPDRSLWDLHLLATSGGGERDEAGWRDLLASAGLRLSEVRPAGSTLAVLVAVAS